MHFKKLIKYFLSTLILTAPILNITACSKEYHDFMTKINNKETFVAYLGIKNCLHCQKLAKQWDLWMEEENWNEGIKYSALPEDYNLDIKRYSYMADYDFKKKDSPLTIYQQSSKGIRLIFEWIENKQKDLWKNNTDINKIIDENYLPNAIPLLVFVKKGEYKWFIMGWGDEIQSNDLLKDNQEFQNNPSFNTSTFKRLVSDFIFNDFKDFYTIKGS